jgi:hypothetical protein
LEGTQQLGSGVEEYSEALRTERVQALHLYRQHHGRSRFLEGLFQSRKLFDLILELKMIEMEYDLILHIVHVSGRHMIRQGSDGLSREDHSQGVMTGASMESFIPLHKTSIERDERLGRWLDDITRGFQLLEPEGWFLTAHSRGNFIWSPPCSGGRCHGAACPRPA